MNAPPGQPPQGMPPNADPYAQQQQQQQQSPQQQAYPQQQQAYPQQPYPQQQYQQQQYQQQPGMQGGPQASGGKQNPALIAVGAIFLLIAAGVGVLFLMNLYQYMTVEDRWANDTTMIREARAFGVRIIKSAAMKRMTMFGPISGLSGIIGLVLLFLGLRKK